MPAINGLRLRLDIAAQNFTHSQLSEATKKFDPDNEGVSTRLLVRATSNKSDVHCVNDRKLALICKVLKLNPDRYYLNGSESINIWGAERRRTVYRAYQAIIAAIDTKLLPRHCWDFYITNGKCFLEYVIENPKKFSTNTKMCVEDWRSAFVDLRQRNILIQLDGGTYRIVSAGADEMVEILEERTELEVKAALRACALRPLERVLIQDEMNLVIEACDELLESTDLREKLIEVESQFHLCWTGQRSAQRRLLTHAISVCTQIGDRLLWIDEDDNIVCRQTSYSEEFREMVSELKIMRAAFSKEDDPDPVLIEKLIRQHTARSKRLITENKSWVNRPWSKKA